MTLPHEPLIPTADPMAQGEEGPPPATAPQTVPLGALVQALQSELTGALHDRLHLVTLEVKQAGISAAQMVVLAVVAALMLCGAWMVLMVGVYMLCTTQGLHWALALGIVLLLNLAGALLLWFKAMALSTAFTFPASLRMIKGLAPGKPSTP